MSNKRVIENKIGLIEKYLTILKNYKKHNLEEIIEDITLKGAIERYLYLLVQATIDLAEALISYKKLRKPTTMRESFDILCEEGIISGELSEKLAKMVGFRNILAHDYEKIDYMIILRVLKNDIKDIKEFIEVVKDKF